MVPSNPVLGKLAELANPFPPGLISTDPLHDKTERVAGSIIQEGQIPRSSSDLLSTHAVCSPEIKSDDQLIENDLSQRCTAFAEVLKQSLLESGKPSLSQEKFIIIMEAVEKDFLILQKKIMDRAASESLNNQDQSNLELVLGLMQQFLKFIENQNELEQKIGDNRIRKIQQQMNLFVDLQFQFIEVQKRKNTNQQAQELHEVKLNLALRDQKLKEEEQKHRYNLDLLKVQEELKLKNNRDLPLERLQRENSQEKNTDQNPLGTFKNNCPFINLNPPLGVFVSRNRFMEKLEENLLPKQTWHENSHMRWLALYGLGGVGKTELACFFANEHLQRFSLVCWIDCETPETRAMSYRTLAKSLKVFISDSMQPDEQHNLIMNKLQNHNFEKPWLLVLDNVIEKLSLPNRGGFVLGTSNTREVWPDLQCCLEVTTFSNEDAATFLKEMTQETDKKSISLLVEELECFPLALGRAADFLKKTNIPVAEYLIELKKDRNLLFQEIGTHRHPTPLMKTWIVTLEHLKKWHPRAYEWVNICAYFNANKIPFAWIHEWLKIEEGTEKKSTGWELQGVLQDYGLIQRDLEKDTFSMHRLVQEVIRLTQKDNALRFYKKAVHLLQQEGDKLDWRFSADVKKEKTWISHTIWVIKHEHFSRIDKYDCGKLLKRIGIVQSLHCNSKAVEILELAVQEFQSINVSDVRHDLAECLKWIGSCQRQLALFDNALSNYSKAIELFKEIYGEVDHPEIAHCLLNLGAAKGNLGHFEEALKLIELAIQMYKKTKDKYFDYYIARCLINKSVFLNGLECNIESILASQEAIKKLKELFKEESHPLIAEAFSQYGHALGENKQFNEAFSVFEETKVMYQNIHGDINHPTIALCLAMMGVTKAGLSRFEEALKLIEMAIQMYKEVKDRNCDYDIAQYLCNKGANLICLGRLTEGVIAFQEAIKIYKEKLGETSNPVIQKRTVT